MQALPCAGAFAIFHVENLHDHSLGRHLVGEIVAKHTPAHARPGLVNILFQECLRGHLGLLRSVTYSPEIAKPWQGTPTTSTGVVTF
jgi:hypothetical protein